MYLLKMVGFLYNKVGFFYTAQVEHSVGQNSGGDTNPKGAKRV